MPFEIELKKILEEKWDHEEKETIERVIKSVLSYKRLMSKALKDDVLKIIDICIKVKQKLEECHEQTDNQQILEKKD
jgi:hypothetical protein